MIPSTAVKATFLGTLESHSRMLIPEAILTRMGKENKLPSCSWKEVMYSPSPKTQLGTTQGTKAQTNAFNSLFQGQEL